MTVTDDRPMVVTDLDAVLAPYRVRGVPRGASRRRIGALAWLTLGEKARRR